ncbi:STAS domain-containing protein [Dactylosporangium sp. NPDC000244]|uniref:STAS domain-containing protein n=1 Tax=Dactylosporangium sp. NPDC000244 TaxID=3154365 RepID=UPI00331D2C5C
MGEESVRPCVVVDRPHSPRSVEISLFGAIDVAIENELDNVLDHVSNALPSSIAINVANVTFACSTLANFIVRLRNIAPAALVVLSGCTPMIHRILCLTGVDDLVTPHDHAGFQAIANSTGAGRSLGPCDIPIDHRAVKPVRPGRFQDVFKS